MSDLLVFTFATDDEAAEVLQRVATAKKENVQEALVAVRDAAVATKNDQGKVKVTQTLEAMVKSGRLLGGGFWGLLIGLLFGGPIIGGLVGIGLRAFGNKKIDVGVDNAFIEDVSNALEPGQSALFLLTENTEPATISQALGAHNGTIFHTTFSADAAEALGALADEDEVAAALAEND